MFVSESVMPMVVDTRVVWESEPEPEPTERRTGERFPLTSEVRISWSDPAGRLISVIAEGRNVSEHGAAFLMDHPLPGKLLVHLEFPHGHLAVSGFVRNCRRRGGRWRVGIEFVSKLPRA